MLPGGFPYTPFYLVGLRDREQTQHLLQICHEFIDPIFKTIPFQMRTLEGVSGGSASQS